MNLHALCGLVFSAALAVSGSPAAAQGTLRDDPRVVLELFTSQGCPNSPRADALLAELAEREDVIALAYHVDYWDYIGWRDTFGDTSFTDRQRDYSAARGASGLYTPQFIINGTAEAAGTDRVAVSAALGESELSVDIELTEDDGVLTIAIPANRTAPAATVWLVPFIDRAQVDIGAGENAGQRLSYMHAVTDRRVLAAWEPGEGASLKLPMPDLLQGASNGFAIVLQADTGGYPGPILGAALYEIDRQAR